MVDKYFPFIATSMVPGQLMAGIEEFCENGSTINDLGVVCQFKNSNLGNVEIGPFYDKELIEDMADTFQKYWV